MPTGPNRLLLMSAVLFFGLIAGCIFAFAMNLMRPVFYTTTDLERRFNVPVLGAVGLVRTSAEIAAERRSGTLLLASVAALIVCYGALLAASTAIATHRGAALSGPVAGS